MPGIIGCQKLAKMEGNGRICEMGKVGQVVRTQKEVARAFGVHQNTVIRWIKKGMPVEDGGYDLLKVGKWSGRTGRGGDERHVAEVLALSENTTLSMGEIGERLGIGRDRVNYIRRVHKEDREIGDFVSDKKAEILAIEQGKGHLVRQRLYERLLSASDAEIYEMPLKMVAEMCRVLGGDNSEAFKDQRLKQGESTENVGVLLGLVSKVKEMERGGG